MYDHPVPLKYPELPKQKNPQPDLTDEELDYIKANNVLGNKGIKKLPLQEYSPLERFIEEFDKSPTTTSRTDPLIWAIKHHGSHVRRLIDERLRTGGLTRLLSLGMVNAKSAMINTLVSLGKGSARNKEFHQAAEYFLVAGIVDNDIHRYPLWPHEGKDSGTQQKHDIWDAIKKGGPQGLEDQIIKYHLGSVRVFNALRKSKGYLDVALAILDKYQDDLRAYKIFKKHGRNGNGKPRFSRREESEWLATQDKEWSGLDPSNMFVEIPFHLQRAINTYADAQPDRYEILKKVVDTNDEGVSMSDRLMMQEYLSK